MIYAEALLYGLLYDANSSDEGEALYMSHLSQKERAETYIREAQQWVLPEGISPDFKQPDDLFLSPIFDLIHFNNQPRGNSFKRYSTLPVNIAKHENTLPSDKPMGTFRQCLQGFRTELNKAATIPQRSAFEVTAFYLLKKYFTFVPLNTLHSALSLFEFLKIRAAVATCLERVARETPLNKDKPILMVCADVSGIQSFIYDIHSRKAARSLKGRSFYLQLLLESVIQAIVNHDDVKMTEGQVLYCSGGKMYMFLPNTDRVVNALDSIALTLRDKVYTEHKTSIYITLTKLPIGKEDFRNPANAWIQLGEEAHSQKFRKYDGRLKDLFTVSDEGFEDSPGNPDAHRLCAVTGSKLTAENSEILNEKDREGEKIYVLKSVKRQAEIGSKLTKAEYYTTFKSEWGRDLSEKQKGFALNPVDLDVFHYVKSVDNVINEYLKTRGLHSMKYSVVRFLNDTNFLGNPDLVKGAAYGFTFYGGNKQSLNSEGELKDHEELAGFESEDDRHNGFHRLGVLRMDVDGLGGIFAEGMRGGLSNFVAYATLSSQLDLFFSGYLNTLRERERFRDNINILYSGGDDLFIVGKWDCLIEFGALIRSEFEHFCGGKKPGISGGLVMVGGKFPISKAAVMAEDGERKGKKELAPNREITGDGLCFFDEVMGWEEYSQVKNYYDKFMSMKEDELPTAFLYKIMDWKKQKDYNWSLMKKVKSKSSGRRGGLQFLWQAAYFLERFAKRNRDNPSTALSDLLDELRLELVVNKNYRFFNILAFAARWAAVSKRN